MLFAVCAFSCALGFADGSPLGLVDRLGRLSALYFVFDIGL